VGALCGCPAEPVGSSASGGEDEGSSTGAASSGTTASSVTSGGTGSTTTGASSAADTSPTTDDPTDDPGTTTGPGEAWLEVGWGLEEFTPLDESGELPVYLGIQGLYMFTVALRGGGFPLPPDPGDFTHPDIPILDLWIDADGLGNGPDGHFLQVVDYAVPFRVDLEDPGTYEFVSVWLLVPDDIDVVDLVGNSIDLHAELATADGGVLTIDRQLVVGAVIEPDFG
jgi:hypothetical protein